MSACDKPQYSAHWPRYVPGLSASNLRKSFWPGTASFLPFSAGIQKEWITPSRGAVTFMLISRPTGMCISVAVKNLSPEYSYSQYHCRPVTLMWTTSLPVGFWLRSKITGIVNTAITARISAGTIVHEISRTVLPCTCFGFPSSPVFSRKRKAA